MADDIVTGQASIVVVPDFRSWQSQIKKQLAATTADFAKAGTEAGTSFAQSFKKSAGDLFAGLKPPDQSAPGAKAGGQFADAFKKRVQAALKSLPDVKIDADSSPAERRIAEIRAQLEELSSKRIGVDITDAEALARVKAFEAELDALARRSPTVSVRVNAAAASAELAAFSAEADAAGRKSGGLGSALEGAGGSMSSLALAGLSLAPALLPVLAVATADALGLGAALGAAAAGTGAFALAALPGVTRVKDALTAQATAAKGAAAAGVSSAGAIRSATEGVQTADEGLQTAEQSLAQAQKGATAAQQSLSAARVQARQDAVDLANSVIDAQLQEKSDTLAIVGARQQLIQANEALAASQAKVTGDKTTLAGAQSAAVTISADPGSTAAQKAAAAAAVAAARAQLAADQQAEAGQALAQKQAALAVTQAIQQLKEQRIATQRLEQQQAEANKAGIAGDKNVVAARQQIVAADQQVANAERGVRDAQRQVADAQFALAQAQGKQTSAAITAGAATAKLTGPERTLLAAFVKLRSEYDGWATDLERPVLGVLTTGLRLAGRLLPSLAPLVRGSAGAFRGLESDAGKALGSPFWQRFERTMDKLAPVAITDLGRALGSVASGAARLAVRAEPFTVGLLGSADRLAKRFSNWTKGDGFSSFLATASKDAKPVGALISALVKALPNIVRGINPLAPVSLAIATALTSLVAHVPPKVITAFAAAFLVWKLATGGLGAAMKIISVATKAWAVAQWLLDAAMDANPISLIVIGIAALVAIIVLIATKTTWFQTAWKVAWKAIKTAAADVWNWIGGAAKIAWKAVTDAVSAAVGKIRGFAADIWDAISRVFGLILDGAVTAFGWIPGIGGKLKAADKAFKTWSKSVDSSIRGIKGHTVNIRFSLQDLAAADHHGGRTALATGGRLAGFGGGDIVPALLEPGEAVVDKHRTRRYASVLGAMGVPGFAAGGPVGVAARDILPPVKPFTTDLTGKITAALTSFSVPLNAGDQGAHGGSARAAQAIARALLPAFGWSQAQMAPLIALWNQESGWNYQALNASSGAYGIPQSLPASKMASAGPDWRTNPVTQERWGLGYIKGRYGSPAGAWSHEQAVSWYDDGGMLPPGYSTVLNATGKPEVVLTAQQWDAITAATRGGDGDVNHFHLGDVGGTVETRVRAAVAAAGVAQRRTQRTGRRK